MISVIIPVYDDGEYLHVCLNSILMQNYVDFEVICIDDASSDDSLEILEYFSKKDSRISFYKNETKKGFEFCKSKGLEVALGDYVYFMGAHGWLDFNAFEILIQAVEQYNLEVLLFKTGVYDEKLKEFNFDSFYDVEFMNGYNLDIFNYRTLDKGIQYIIQYLPLNKFYSKTFLYENNLLEVNSSFFNNVFNCAQRVSFLNKKLYTHISTLSSIKNYRVIFNLFINEFMPFFQNISNIIEVDSLIIFNILKTIEELLINKHLFDYLKLVFFEFKLCIFKKCLFEYGMSNPEEFYDNMRQEFIDMNLEKRDLEKIDFELYQFYIRVLNYNYLQFNRFNSSYKTYFNYIIKKDLTKQIENFNEIGINTEKRNESIIVSLTSFPERLFDIHFCLYSLLKQTLKPDKIILCLVRDEFPNGENDIPFNVLKLKKNGLTIKWCDNFRSFTKLIPVLKDYPDDYIVTVDDDIFYPEDLLENLWNTYQKYPKTIISSRTRIMKMDDKNQFESYINWDLANGFLKPSFLNFITGVGGALYFPNALSEIIFKENLFKELCPTADDIWFWAMAVLNKTKITGTLKQYNVLNYVNISRELGIDNSHTLWNFNQKGHNDIQLKKVLDYFPEILNIINED